MKTTVNTNSEVYYQGQYWNDIPEVFKYICKNFTGDENIWWVEDFKKRYAPEPFSHALFINCGNGRVEREFIDKGIVKNADSFDYSGKLLEEAKNQKGERSIHYFQADANTVLFPENKYDLIVNVAGLHHVQFINRFVYQLGRSLKNDGIMVNFDYVGPHRNQYPQSQWELVQNINQDLPESMKHAQLLYPSVPVMLQEDPTEAIHSELIIETLNYYFDIVEKHDTGGGLAYLLFSNNKNLFKHLSAPQIKQEIQKILDLERNLLKKDTIPNLFSYIIAKPNNERLHNSNVNILHRNREERREFISGLFGNVYRPQDVVSLVLFTIKNRVKKMLDINNA